VTLGLASGRGFSQVPALSTGPLQFGRMSVPIIPHLVQTALRSGEDGLLLPAVSVDDGIVVTMPGAAEPHATGYGRA
jgi:hypothetical protein